MCAWFTMHLSSFGVSLVTIEGQTRKNMFSNLCRLAQTGSSFTDCYFRHASSLFSVDKLVKESVKMKKESKLD